MSLIGIGLLEQRDVSSILLFADSPVAPTFQVPTGMDYVKLPSIVKRRPGAWEPASLRLETPHVLKMRTELLRHTITAFQPDLLVVDHMPGGAQGELLPTLEALQRDVPGCHVALGLRDILDCPETVKRIWWDDKAYHAIHRYYETILVYGDRDLFDTASTYLLPCPSGGIHFCGYVANDADPRPAAHMRQRYALPPAPLVLVTAGGGNDGYNLMHTYLGAVRHLGSSVPFFTLMTLGPNSPHDLRQSLRDQADGLPVRIVARLDDSFSAMAASDVVVSMAGYNTMAESLRLRKRTIVVPRSGPSEEQRIRARLFSQRGLIDTIPPESLSPECLADHLLRAWENRSSWPHQHVPCLDGVQNAVSHLLEVAHAERRATA
jgi:predicted glycosyltransferase